MSIICVIGTGYVGLVTGACFADIGNTVTCVDIAKEKIDRLNAGLLPIYEPGLEEMVDRNVRAGRLRFTTSYPEGLEKSAFIFIAVNTPTGNNQGGADMRFVESAARSIGEHLDHYAIIINKSTVPVGSGDVVSRVIHNNLKRPDVTFSVVSNPEFLREGAALQDFQNPDRVVLGSSEPQAAHKVAQLYLSLRAPIVITDLYTAEMIKYASNAFLATKISFINEIAQICERLGADVKEVSAGMGYDKRIGHAFLDAGLGYGGSCFEASETVFPIVESTVVGERIDTLFNEWNKTTKEHLGEVVQHEEGVQVVRPIKQKVLAFDLTTGKSTIADVQALTRRSYKGQMITMKLSMGRVLRVTADHPVIVYKKEQFVIVPAEEIATGDQLMALCEYPANITPAPAQLEMIEKFFRSAKYGSLFQSPQDTPAEYVTIGRAKTDSMALALQTLDVIPSLHLQAELENEEPSSPPGTINSAVVKKAMIAKLREEGKGEELFALRMIGCEKDALLQTGDGGKPGEMAKNPKAEQQAKNQGYKRHGAFTTLTVREVQRQAVNTFVYSMETSTGTLIAASGLICHNCFPKDVRALAHMADEAGLHPQLLHAVMEINHDQRRLIVTKLTNILGCLRGCTIGVLGLAFKPNTDDMREAPAVDIIRWITNQGAQVRAYDPVAMETGREALLQGLVHLEAVTFCEDAYAVAEKADALIIVTDWNEFKSLNMQQIRHLMHRPVLVDGRNIYEPTEMEEMGFIYRGMGRGGTRAPSVLPPGDTSGDAGELRSETVLVGRLIQDTRMAI